MNYIVLDFETHDPWIKQGRGSGWPEKQAKFLCAATHCNGLTSYHTDIDKLKRMLENDPMDSGETTIIAHNAQYEAGILHSYGFDIESVTWIDTMILAKLFYNNLDSFSLDSLAKLYLGETKDEQKLGEIAKDLGLVKSVSQNPIKVAKENMDRVFERNPNAVRGYVEQDVLLCQKLFNYFMYENQEEGIRRFDNETIEYHSDLIKALTLSRARGVRVHIPTALRVKGELMEHYEAAMLEARKLTDINLNSSKQLAEYFDSQGAEYPKTDKGNPSITKEWLEESDHPLGQLITKSRKYLKLVRDFIEPVLELATPVDQWGHLPAYVRVYPEIKIYGASATGRASCANPNLQQVPKRDAAGQLVRTMYHPEPNQYWYSLDFSSQEPRLQVHYAAKLGAPGVQLLLDQYKANHQHDLHGQVAELAKIERKQAKTINLGLSYGMGDNKLAVSLGLTLDQARILKGKFNRLVPFLNTLNRFAQKTIKIRGYIKTVGGRKLYNEQGFERKGLNKLIQGSAADQTWKAIVECYRAGYIPLTVIHDSLELSLSSDEDAAIVKKIMETSTPLMVPSYSDVQKGNNWGELK